MTLAFLENMRRQLQEQHDKLPSTANPDKPVLLHCNYIELAGAIQLADQLIAQEKIMLAAPPGATGPDL